MNGRHGNPGFSLVPASGRETAERTATRQLLRMPDGAEMIVPTGVIRDDDPFDTVEDLLATAAVGLLGDTMIATPEGERAVASLAEGDLIDTRDGGAQAIRLIAQSEATADGVLAPVTIAPDTFGRHRALTVAPQQRILISDWRADLLFGEAEVLIPARFLTNGQTVKRADAGATSYYIIMLTRHDALWANGLMTETFQPSVQALSLMQDETRARLLQSFPQLRNDPSGGYGNAVRPTLRQWEVKYLMR
ncbi:MAG: Hint domain-containing protein [Pseudomonadota bacterium]